MSGALADTDIVVLAGGLGTRIQPVLGDVPKILAPIHDRTYLDYLLDWLQAFGARRVILSLGYQAQQIMGFVTRHPRDGLIIETVVEPEPLGTAGALRLVRSSVVSEISLVMNGDSWTGANLGDFRAAHVSNETLATLLCVHVNDAGRYGLVDVDAAGRIRAFQEKNPDAGPGLINAGIYAFGAEAWKIIENTAGSSLERDVFQALAPSTLAAYDAGNVPFIDIGTPESLAQAVTVIGKNASRMGDA